MQAACARFLVCPVCRRPLRPAGAALRCAGGHGFDVAREGYVNLLLTRHRRARMVGDTQAMVAARAGFLARGHYAPLADAVAELVAGHLRSQGAAGPGARADAGCVLDVGCGTGYQLGRLRERLLADGGPLPCLFGTDVSKHAVRRLRSTMELNGTEAAELARMGPSAWHLAPAALAAVERLDRLAVTADFHLGAYTTG
jgi:23S rRNA (guanine745-N1)-methyltransferase